MQGIIYMHRERAGEGLNFITQAKGKRVERANITKPNMLLIVFLLYFSAHIEV